jgi:hypothetical protein
MFLSTSETLDKVYLRSGAASDDFLLRGIPYVIREGGLGRGLFSLVSSIVCHLHIADKYGMIPIVDLQSRRCEYTDDILEGLSSNAWDNYFEPVSKLALDDIDATCHCVLSQEGYPDGYPYSVSGYECFRQVFSKYIKVKAEHQSEFDQYKGFMRYKVLGVHYREQEMRTARGHWYPPSLKQIVTAIDYALNTHGFDRIFVVTEDSDYLLSLQRRYGKMMFSLDSYRSKSPVNSYKVYPRAAHKYLLGKECLFDTMMLGKCHGLVRCTSNIAEGARLFRGKAYDFEIKINNGPNNAQFGRLRLHQYSWRYKSIAPAWAGGFNSQAITVL